MKLGRGSSEDRDRGAVLPLVALVLGALITITAITIDLGRLEVLRRDLQAAADVISLDLVRHVDGRTRNQIETATATPTWSQLQTYSEQRNNVAPSKVTVDLGIVDATQRVDSNLSNGSYRSAGPSEVPNAVKVTITDNLNYFFAIGSGRTTRSAVAALNPNACFDVGSYALGLNTANSTIFQSLFGQMLNSNLTAVGYQGLASANLSLLQILNSQSQVGTVDELLNEQMTFGQFRVLMINALNNSGQTGAASVLNGVSLTSAQSNGTVSFGNLITASQGSGSAASTSWNVLDLFAGAAFLSNGSNFLSIPNLGITVPGLLSAGLNNFFLIQKPAHACSPKTAQTSQANVPLSINAQVNACSLTGVVPGLSALLGALTCTLGGGVSLQTAHIDLTFGLASSTGTMGAVTCSGATKTATINVQSNLIVPHAKVTILGLTAMDTDLSSQSTSTGSNVNFAVPPDVLPATKAAGSGQLGFNNMSFGGALGTALDPIVQPLLQALQPQLFGPLGDSLGLRIAGADVTLRGLDCTRPDLVG